MNAGAGGSAGSAERDASGSGGPPQASPKRAREDQQTDLDENRDGGPLTLAVLQQALQVNQQQITQSLQDGLAGIGHRVAQAEAN